MARSCLLTLGGAFVLAAALSASSDPAAAAGGCEGWSVSIQPAGRDAPWTLEVPFDDGFATLATGQGARRSVILNETCSSRRMTFDLVPAAGSAGGRCTIALEGSDAVGGCRIDGIESPVTGLVRRGLVPDASQGSEPATSP